jgi:hypothetical protein
MFGRFIAWTCDQIDFLSVSLSVTHLQKQFNKAEASTIVRCLHFDLFSLFAISAIELLMGLLSPFT